MIYLAAIFAPPLYFLLCRRWGVFVIHSLLYLVALCCVIFSPFTIIFAPLFIGAGVILWAVLAVHATSQLREEKVKEQAELIAARMAEKVTFAPQVALAPVRSPAITQQMHSSRGMTCEELKELVELYSLGLAEGDEKAEIDEHLAHGCETCQKNLTGALAMNSALLTLVPNVAPPRRLKRRIMASIGVERSRWGWAAALAAGCMLLVALWLSVEERQRASELADARRTLLGVTAQRDRLQQALSFLDDPATLPVSFGKGQPTPPRGNVFVHPRLGVLLIASNLPPAASGRIYEMWVIPKVGAPRPAGLFQSEPAGTALHMLSGPVDTSTLGAIAVTLEPESGSPAPTTTPIIVAPVAGV